VINGTISRRNALQVLQEAREISDRGARADVGSAYGAGWPEPRGRINDRFAKVNSFEAWLRTLNTSHPSSIANGKKRGSGVEK
jgi:hypothetical protein